MLTSEEFQIESLCAQQQVATKDSEQSGSSKEEESPTSVRTVITPDSHPVRFTRKPSSPFRRISSQSSNDADSSTDTGECSRSPSPKTIKWDYRKKIHELQTKLEDQKDVICMLTNRVIDTERELEIKSSELLTSLLAVEEAEEMIKKLRLRVDELENTSKCLDDLDS